MTGNKSFLTDYQEADGGFIAFARSPKGGKITGKGKIRTGKLDFEDVYFVKELKFNLFSISQMCNKKNSVCFTKTECLVLSPDFKLLDESQVLLKVPRQNNIYSFDLKNGVPSGDKYMADILKKFDFSLVKTASTPIETNKALLKDEEAEDYPRDSPFDLEAFSDSDYARASLDRKSIIGGCQFLGKRLTSWQCKKKTIVANSTTKAEYVAAANYYGQVLWIQNQMLEYGFNFMNTKIYIDNESTICIVKNPVFHSKTKHIEIRQHFNRDSYEKKLIQVIKIHTDQNVTDLLTKAFDV
ncbi:hypothetical protein Tco_0928865, partial [Tanacetum coccineum]